MNKLFAFLLTVAGLLATVAPPAVLAAEASPVVAAAAVPEGSSVPDASLPTPSSDARRLPTHTHSEQRGASPASPALVIAALVADGNHAPVSAAEVPTDPLATLTATCYTASVGSAGGPLGCLRALRDAWRACRGEGGIGSEACRHAGKVILLECSGVVGALITCLNTSSDFWDFVVCMIGEMIWS